MDAASPPPDSNEPDAQEATNDEALVHTTECPSCGRRFVGTYCPNCGEKARRSLSVADVVGGAVREVVDVEQGFWPTFVGLTLRPGRVLREYLHGAQRKFTSPGRYLVAAAVIAFGIERVLVWIGAKGKGADAASDGPLLQQGREGQLTVAFTFDLFSTSTGLIVFALALAAVLAAPLWTAFRDRFRRVGGALALSTFLTAHGLFLLMGMELLYYLPPFLSGTGPPPDAGAGIVGVTVGAWMVYLGVAVALCFDRDGWSAMKGIVSAIVGLVELFGITVIGIVGYVAWGIWHRPDAFVSEAISPSDFSLMYQWLAGIAAIAAMPIVVHAGIELYRRLQASRR